MPSFSRCFQPYREKRELKLSLQSTPTDLPFAGRAPGLASVGKDGLEMTVQDTGSPELVKANSDISLAGLRYVIITPAKDEEKTIGSTIESILQQTLKPAIWIIVDDGSSDRTAEIVESYMSSCNFLRLLRRPPAGQRQFGSKALAFGAGYQLLAGAEYEFIGNLDADISLEPDHFERVLRWFAQDPRLGISGGMVYSKIDETYICYDRTSDSVGGAIQLFRRKCFEQVGGYLPLERGGIDAAAEITARMHGWLVRKVPQLKVYEHRRTGSAQAGPVLALYKEGVRFHTLGYGTSFFTLRAVSRIMDRPIFIGSAATMFGFLAAKVKRYPILLPSETVSYLRAEQMSKMLDSVARVFSKLIPVSLKRQSKTHPLPGTEQ